MFHWDDKSSKITSNDKENFAAGRDEYPFPEIPRFTKQKTSSLPATTPSPKRSKKTVNIIYLRRLMRLPFYRPKTQRIVQWKKWR